MCQYRDGTQVASQNMTQNVFPPSPSPPQLFFFFTGTGDSVLIHNRDIQIGYKSGITFVPASHLWYVPVKAVGRESKENWLCVFWLSLRIMEHTRNLCNRTTLFSTKSKKQSQGTLIHLIIDIGQPNGYLKEMKSDFVACTCHGSHLCSE